MHVKYVSRVTFYHLSNRYLPNAMKISAKINTVQNINILLCSFTKIMHKQFPAMEFTRINVKDIFAASTRANVK